MKLYYVPGACSMAPHITLSEVGADFELEKVDLAAKKTAGGEDYLAVNPLGYVPALRLGDGTVITEGPAILQFIADRHPQAGLAPAAGTIERVRLQSLLNFITSELHKSYSPLFSPTTVEAAKQAMLDKLQDRYRYVEGLLADGRDYLTGDHFTVADAYLFTVTNWAKHVGLSLDAFPRLQAFQKRVAARASVQEAMRAEGLVN